MDTAFSQICVGRSETIEDAAAQLRQKSSAFAESGGAEVRIGGVKYLDFITRWAVILLGPIDANDTRWAIGMASAEKFTARQAIHPDERQSLSIERLDHACVDQFGNVTLADKDETRIYDVRLVPCEMPHNLTEKETEALRIALISIREKPFINFSILPSLGKKLRRLKRLRYYDLWREHYRSAFLKTGIRQPRRGKHAGL
jgi:hypothetical protein